MDQLLGASITYRIAVGPHQGRKVFTLQTLPAWDDSFGDEVGKVAGFSLHAGVMARADERQKLERLCRYVSRPAVSEKRLSLTANGQVRYQLKTPYRDGTTHVIFEPLDKIAGSDFEQPKVGPKGGGQEARSNSLPGWPRWCLSPESTSRGYADLRIAASMPTSGLCGVFSAAPFPERSQRSSNCA